MLPTNQAAQPQLLPKPRRWLLAKDAAQVAGTAIILYLAMITVAQPHMVDGASMQPNFHTGEYVLTNSLAVDLNQLRRGQVIVLRSPSNDPGKLYYKRIIGLPTERIKVASGRVTIYNQQNPKGMTLKEPYLNGYTPGKEFLKEGQGVTIPKHQFVVMGDNRNNSYDSRSWGFLDQSNIMGVAYFVYWPLTDLGIISGITYAN